MSEPTIRWTRAEALACAYCWAEFPSPEVRPDSPEQYWRSISERSRQECRKIVKDRYLLAVAFRQAAPVFPPSNLTDVQLESVREALGLKARHRVWMILQAVHRVFLPHEWGDADRAAIKAGEKYDHEADEGIGEKS
jgi:hypothetical protein